jgi:hypothetical protein
MVYNTIQQTPPPHHSHTLSVYTVHLVWEEGGEGQRELRGATVHITQVYVVLSSTGATVHKLGLNIPTMSECISSL